MQGQQPAATPMAGARRSRATTEHTDAAESDTRTQERTVTAEAPVAAEASQTMLNAEGRKRANMSAEKGTQQTNWSTAMHFRAYDNLAAPPSLDALPREVTAEASSLQAIPEDSPLCTPDDTDLPDPDQHCAQQHAQHCNAHESLRSSPSGATILAAEWSVDGSPPPDMPHTQQPTAMETDAHAGQPSHAEQHAMHTPSLAEPLFSRKPPTPGQPNRWANIAEEEEQELAAAPSATIEDETAAQRNADDEVVRMLLTDGTEPGTNNYVEAKAVLDAAGDELELWNIEVPEGIFMAYPAHINQPDQSVRDWRLQLTRAAKEAIQCEGGLEVENRAGQKIYLKAVPSNDRGQPMMEDPRDAARRMEKAMRDAQHEAQREERRRQAKQQRDKAKEEKQQRTMHLRYRLPEEVFFNSYKPGALDGVIKETKKAIEKAFHRANLGDLQDRCSIAINQSRIDQTFADTELMVYITFPADDNKMDKVDWSECKYISRSMENQMTAFMPGPLLNRLGLAKCCYQKWAQCSKVPGRPCSMKPRPFAGPSPRGPIDWKRKQREDSEDERSARQKEKREKICDKFMNGEVRAHPKQSTLACRELSTAHPPPERVSQCPIAGCGGIHKSLEFAKRIQCQSCRGQPCRLSRCPYKDHRTLP